MRSVKNNWLKYVLAPIVIVIWASAFYRYFVFSPQAVELKGNKNEQNEGAGQIFKPDRSAFDLKGGYRDPFLTAGGGEKLAFGKIASSQSQPIFERPYSPSLENEVVVKPQINWEFLKYYGFAKVTGELRILGLMSIHKRMYSVEEGQIYGGIEVASLWEDSLRVRFENEEHTIRRQ